MSRWEKTTWTTNDANLHTYAHQMFERRGYCRVDTPRQGLYYACHGNTFTWFEWNPPAGLFTSLRLGFWELYRQAHEENSIMDAHYEAGA